MEAIFKNVSGSWKWLIALVGISWLPIACSYLIRQENEELGITISNDAAAFILTAIVIAFAWLILTIKDTPIPIDKPLLLELRQIARYSLFPLLISAPIIIIMTGSYSARTMITLISLFVLGVLGNFVKPDQRRPDIISLSCYQAILLATTLLAYYYFYFSR